MKRACHRSWQGSCEQTTCLKEGRRPSDVAQRGAQGCWDAGPFAFLRSALDLPRLMHYTGLSLQATHTTGDKGFFAIRAAGSPRWHVPLEGPGDA